MQIDKDIGSIVIEEQKHLQEYSDPALKYFSKTLTAGQLGRLLGKLRKLEVIKDFEKIKVFAADLGIYDEDYLASVLLPKLEHKGVIDIYKDGTGFISKIEENIASEEEILKITGELWNESLPGEEEQISVDIIDICTDLPRLNSELQNEILKKGYKEANIGIELSKKFSIVQEYNVPGIVESVFHTPNYARENVTKIMHTLKQLNYEDKQLLEKNLDYVSHNQASPISKMNTPPNDIMLRCEQIGLIDLTKVETVTGRSESFLFTPSIWSPFGTALLKDEQEHVRALLSCIKFGQIAPTEIDGKKFQIKMPDKYIAAFLRNKRVGPSTPIGTDYIILEKEGIVNIEPSSTKPGQYEMVLVKDDIAESAQRILCRGKDITIESSPEDPKSLSQVGSFENPVQSRIRSTGILKKRANLKSETIDKQMIRLLRGGKG